MVGVNMQGGVGIFSGVASLAPAALFFKVTQSAISKAAILVQSIENPVISDNARFALVLSLTKKGAESRLSTNKKRR